MGPEIETFVGPEMARAKRVLFGPKKVEISGPTPSNGLSNGFARIKIIKSKSHVNKQVHWSFFVHEFQGPPLPMAIGIVVDGGGGGPAGTVTEEEQKSSLPISNRLSLASSESGNLRGDGDVK